jgi:hypothetical protein
MSVSTKYNSHGFLNCSTDAHKHSHVLLHLIICIQK